MTVLKTSRVILTHSTLGAVLLAISAGVVAAQTPAAPAPGTQKPASQAPAAQPPAAPAQAAPAPAPAPPKPFPEGAKIAYVNVQAIASNSAEGKSATGKIADLQKKKKAELDEKNKQLQGAQTKLQQGGSVLNDQARASLEKDIEKITRELQFAQQDAEAEIRDLQTQLQQDFQEKLNPVLVEVANERGLHYILDIQSAGAVWWNTGLELTADVIRRFDAATKTAPVKK